MTAVGSGFKKLDEGVWRDQKGIVYEETADGKLVPVKDKPTTALSTELSTDIGAVVDLEGAKKLWKQFQQFKSAIIEEGDFDKIGDKKDLNRTGWHKLGAAFGISVTKLEELRDTADGVPFFQFTVRASKGPRHEDGVGSAGLDETSEKETMGKRMHLAMTKAYTRAAKRAISDLLGGADVED